MKQRSLYCIGPDVPEATASTLEAACRRRNLGFMMVDPLAFHRLPQPLPSGSMLYRPTATAASFRMEELLAGPGVATFYAGEHGPLQDWRTSWIRLARAGVPVPLTITCLSGDRGALQAAVEALGGFPLIVKFPGGSNGVGVMLAESWGALYAMVDLALALGPQPVLQPYLGQAEHWRVVVVGPRSVAAYPNPRRQNDFRSTPSTNAADYLERPAPHVEAAAVSAVRALNLELGGVDVMVGAGGCWVLEVNFPLYHPHAEEVAGLKVSDAMVGWLATKADAQAGLGPAGR